MQRVNRQMGKLGFIQEALGSKLLKIRTRSNRSPKVYTFGNAHNVGIVYDVINKATHQKIAEFADFISRSHSGMQVTMLGFLDNKEWAASLSKIVRTEFYTAEDFSWSGRLLHGRAFDFAKEPFDILLDITTETSYPVQYVSLASKASFKVGRYVEDDQHYDLLLDVRDNNSIENLLTQINVYLTKIKVK